MYNIFYTSTCQCFVFILSVLNVSHAVSTRIRIITAHFFFLFLLLSLIDLMPRNLESAGSSLLIQLWLRVPALGDISSVSPPHAATCQLASHFRGDMLQRSPFNTAPAASIDWFSPTVGAQLSPSLLHLLVLCTDYGKVRSREDYKKDGVWVNAPLRYYTNVSACTGQSSSLRPVARAILGPAMSPWGLGEERWLMGHWLWTLAHFNLPCCCFTVSCLGLLLIELVECVACVNEMTKHNQGQGEHNCETATFIRKFTLLNRPSGAGRTCCGGGNRRRKWANSGEVNWPLLKIWERRDGGGRKVGG